MGVEDDRGQSADPSYEVPQPERRRPAGDAERHNQWRDHHGYPVSPTYWTDEPPPDAGDEEP